MKNVTAKVFLKTLFFSCVFLQGCRTHSPYHPPTPPTAPNYTEPQPMKVVAAPLAKFSAPEQQFKPDLEVPKMWWRLFQCPALDQMVDEAIRQSPGLDQARARLRQAELEYRAESGATQLPSASLGASTTQQKKDLRTMGLPNTIANPDAFTLWNLSANVSYTFDFSGANRHTLQALVARTDFERHQLRAAQLTLAGNLVATVIDRASAREQLRIQKSILQIERQKLVIQRDRLQVGGITEADLAQQEKLVAQQTGLLPPLQLRAEKLRVQLAVYLGREPGNAEMSTVELESLHLPEALPLSAPSSLVQRRPDIQAADALLRKAGEEAGVAAANLYPQFTLTGSFATQRQNLSDLANGFNVWNIGAGLAQPLFNGGELRSKKKEALAAYDEAFAAYKQTVLEGLLQTAESMQALEQDALQLHYLAEAADHAQTNCGIAHERYDAGGISQLSLIDAQKQSLQTEYDQIAAVTARLKDTAAFLTAIGGGSEQ